VEDALDRVELRDKLQGLQCEWDSANLGRCFEDTSFMVQLYPRVEEKDKGAFPLCVG
jgi:hypothetical protein